MQRFWFITTCFLVGVPLTLGCSEEVIRCPDNKTWVGRNKAKNCRFDKCPKMKCSELHGELVQCRLVDGCRWQQVDQTCVNVTSEKPCSDDTKECSNGYVLFRRSELNCEFEECPQCSSFRAAKRCKELRGCTWVAAERKCETASGEDKCNTDVRLCPNGERVRRNPDIDCRFPACPKGECTDYIGKKKKCETSLGCSWEESTQLCVDSSQGKTCKDDTRTCKDGTVLKRKPSLGCRFGSCSPMCKSIVSQIDCLNMGKCKWMEVEQRCEKRQAEDLTDCDQDRKACPDGTIVKRDPQNNCKFEQCSTLECSLFDRQHCRNVDSCRWERAADMCTARSCQSDTKTCSDGTVLQRKPELNCKFGSCRNKCNSILSRNHCINENMCVWVAAEQRCGRGEMILINEDVTEPTMKVVRQYSGNDCQSGPCLMTSCSSYNGKRSDCRTADECKWERASETCTPKFCPDDIKTCKDGTVLRRKPSLDCKFGSCRTKCKSILSRDNCTNEDGCIWVAAEQRCEKSGGEKTPCADDTLQCPDGTLIKRDPDTNCQFGPCPVVQCSTFNGQRVKCRNAIVCRWERATGICILRSCSDDTKICSNGTVLHRKPELNCKFGACRNKCKTILSRDFCDNEAGCIWVEAETRCEVSGG